MYTDAYCILHNYDFFYQFRIDKTTYCLEAYKHIRIVRIAKIIRLIGPIISTASLFHLLK